MGTFFADEIFFCENDMLKDFLDSSLVPGARWTLPGGSLALVPEHDASTSCHN